MQKFKLVGAAALAAFALSLPSGAISQEQQFEITDTPQQCPAGYVQEQVYECRAAGQPCVFIGYTCAPA